MLESLILACTPISSCTVAYDNGHHKTSSVGNASDRTYILPYLDLLDLSETRFTLEEGIGHLFGSVRTLLLGSATIPLQNLRVLQELGNLQNLTLQVGKGCCEPGC